MPFAIDSFPAFGSILPDIERARDLLMRLTRIGDVPEPVAAWRAVPEELICADEAERGRFIGMLLPLMRRGYRVRRRALRRLYQLFTLLDLAQSVRLDFLHQLYTRELIEPEQLGAFAEPRISRALMVEAIALAGRAPSRESKAYIARLAAHLQIKVDGRRWTALFEHLTNTENRIAAMLGKRGHIVRIDDRKLEIFKKAVAAVGVPAAVLFPLGTVGLSVEGIGTGLISLGGGFLLPAGIATIAGLGVAVALGISAKKILDLVIPTTDADRFSVDAEKLSTSSIAIERILEQAAADDADRRKIDEARDQIAGIIRQIVPISDQDRIKIAAALSRSRELGGRYLEYLRSDAESLRAARLLGAKDLMALLEADGKMLCP